MRSIFFGELISIYWQDHEYSLRRLHEIVADVFQGWPFSKRRASWLMGSHSPQWNGQPCDFRSGLLSRKVHKLGQSLRFPKARTACKARLSHAPSCVFSIHHKSYRCNDHGICRTTYLRTSRVVHLWRAKDEHLGWKVVVSYFLGSDVHRGNFWSYCELLGCRKLVNDLEM